MSLLTRYIDDAYYSWMSAAMSCCGDAEQSEKRNRMSLGVEKPMTILHQHQPRLIPSPQPVPQWPRSRTNTLNSRMSFRSRKKSSSTSSLRRPIISAPMNFVHIDQADLPHQQPRRGFRPLELSIYVDNHLSPILPHFDAAIDEPTPPPSVHTRSDSAMSTFTIRRKPLSRTSTALLQERTRTSTELIQPLRPRPSRDTLDLQKPAPARLRAYTAPAFQLERVVSALQEIDELDKKLKEVDTILEDRRSVYNMTISRPGSSYRNREGETNTSRVYQSEEPLPPTKPAESQSPSTSTTSRPVTAPARPTVHIPHRAKSFTEAASTFRPTHQPNPLGSHMPSLSLFPKPSTPPNVSPQTPQTITPPLPLILSAPSTTTLSSHDGNGKARPPLRKKKSFSRVSHWLLRDQKEHTRNISLDSITNMPKPVTAREGFYSVQIPGRNADVQMSVKYGRQEVMNSATATAAARSNSQDSERFAASSATSSIVEDESPTDHEEEMAIRQGRLMMDDQSSVSVTTDEEEDDDDDDECLSASGERLHYYGGAEWESEVEEHTVPTTWTGTPDSSPSVLTRTKTFGEASKEKGLSLWSAEREAVRVSSVGVAF